MGKRYSRIDKWAQYWNASILETGVNAATELIVPVPRPIYTVGGIADSAIIIEILQITVDYFFGDEEAGRGFKFAISTRSRSQNTTMVPEIHDPECFFRYQKICKAGTHNIIKGMIAANTFDYTDDEGRGFLIATDNIYYTVESLAGTDRACEVYTKLLYRFVRVPLREYIGIVQSQG